MRDLDLREQSGELHREVDPAKVPGRRTLVDPGAASGARAGTPGRRTLVPAPAGGELEGLLADAKRHTQALDVALTAKDGAKTKEAAASLERALAGAHQAVGQGGADELNAMIAIAADAEPLLARAKSQGTPDEIAAQGTQGAGGRLPFFDEIQRAFGRHDVSGIQAHVGGDAGAAAGALGARAFATGSSVAFAGTPDLHTAAHEAAHVVQQRGGVQLKALDGGSGDSHERHADAVADAVVSGRSAEGLLDHGPSGGAPAVQRKGENPPTGGGAPDEKKKKDNHPSPNPATPKPGADKQEPQNVATGQGKPAVIPTGGKPPPKKNATPPQGKQPAAVTAPTPAPDQAPKKPAAAAKYQPAPVQPVQPVAADGIAPIAPIDIPAPKVSERTVEQWVKTTGRTPAEHHAQIVSAVSALTTEVQAKQTELSTQLDTTVKQVNQQVTQQVTNFTTSVIAPGRQRVVAAYDGINQSLDTAQKKAATDIATHKTAGQASITQAKNTSGPQLKGKFDVAKKVVDQTVAQYAPQAIGEIKKFAAGIKPFIDKAKQDATKAADTAVATNNWNPSLGVASGGLASAELSLKNDIYKSKALDHGKELGKKYEDTLTAVGKDVDKRADKMVRDALEPAKTELDAALDVYSTTSAKSLDTTTDNATKQLLAQEQTATKAVTDASTHGKERIAGDKATALDAADQAGRELTDNAKASGTELTDRIKKRISTDAKQYAAIVDDLNKVLRKGGPHKFEQIEPKIAEARTRLTTVHQQNMATLAQLSTDGTSELTASLAKQQQTYEAAITDREQKAKQAQGEVVQQIGKGATDFGASLGGISTGFTETVTQETGKIDGAVKIFNTGAATALTDFGTKLQQSLEKIRTDLDAELVKNTAPDHFLADIKKPADAELQSKKKQASTDAATLRDAMDGWGTDENKIYATLRKCSYGQIEYLEATYDDHYDNRATAKLRPLRADLDDEMSGNELKIAMSYLNHDRTTAIKLELEDSCQWWNDDEARIEEVLRSADESEITYLNTNPDAMKTVETVKGHLGGCDLDVMTTLLDQKTSREDRATKANAIRLFDTMEGVGTDEAKLKSILENAKTPEERQRLRAEFDKYAISKGWNAGDGKEGSDALDKALEDDLSGGDLIVAKALSKTDRDEKDVKVAKMLDGADGAGTNEDEIYEALDDEEYAKAWAEATPEMRKTLEAQHKADINKRMKGMDGPYDDVDSLIDGEMSKSDITFGEILDKKHLDGRALSKEELESCKSGKLEWMMAERKLKTGQAEPALQLAYACWGVVGTDEDLINKVLSTGGEPKTRAEVAKIRRDFEAVWGEKLIDFDEVEKNDPSYPDPGGLLSSELGGKDWNKTRVLLCGKPETPAQLKFVTGLQSKYATSGILGSTLMSGAEAIGYTSAKSTMEHSQAKFDAYYAENIKAALADKNFTELGANGERLQQLGEYLQQDVEAYSKALSSVVDAVVTCLEVIGGAIITVVTAGTASPVLAAIIANLVLSAGTITFKYAALGDQYGAGDFAKDVIKAVGTSAFAGLGEAKFLKEATEGIGKSVTGKLFTAVDEGIAAGGGRLVGTTIELGPKGIKTVQNIVTNGTKNLILSSGQEIYNTLTDEKTYDKKLGEALWGEDSLGARLLKSAPKAFVDGAVKGYIDEVAGTSNLDQVGRLKNPLKGVLANAMSDMGGNTAGFFVYVDNYTDAEKFWTELFKSNASRGLTGAINGYAMHKSRPQRLGRDFIKGEVSMASLDDMHFLEEGEVKDLAEFVKKYGDPTKLPDRFKKAIGMQVDPQPANAKGNSPPKHEGGENNETEPPSLESETDENKTKNKQEEERKEQEKRDAEAKRREEEQRAAEEAAAKKKQEEEAAAKQRAEAEAAAKKKHEEEEAAAAKKREEEAAAAKQKEEEAAARKKQEEEQAAARKKAAEEEAARKKQEEAQAAAAAKKQEQEAAAAAAKRKEEEATAYREKAAKEGDEKKQQEDAMWAQHQREEEEAKKAAARVNEDENESSEQEQDEPTQDDAASKRRDKRASKDEQKAKRTAEQEEREDDREELAENDRARKETKEERRAEREANKRDFTSVVPGTVPDNLELTPKQRQLFEAAKAEYERIKKAPYQGEDFAKAQWYRMLQEAGLNVGGLTEGPRLSKAVETDEVKKGAAEPQLHAEFTVAGDNSITNRASTDPKMHEAVSVAALKEAAAGGKGFTVDAAASGEKDIRVTVNAPEGAFPLRIKVADPDVLGGGQLAGFKNGPEPGEVTVWISKGLPDDQAVRAMSGVLAQAVAQVRVENGATGIDPTHAGQFGQLDGMMSHLQKVRTEEATPLLPIDPNGTAQDRIGAATKNAKRESSARVQAEIDLMMHRMGIDQPGEQRTAALAEMGKIDPKLAEGVRKYLEERPAAIGFNPEGTVEANKVAQPSKEKDSLPPSSVLPGEPEQVKPYTAADRTKVLELRVALEGIKEIDGRLAQRDQNGTTGDRGAIAKGETMRRRELVQRAQALMSELQLGGVDPAYYKARLAELEAVFPGVSQEIAPAVMERVEQRVSAARSHSEAVEFNEQATKYASEKVGKQVRETDPFLTDRIVVGDGVAGLSDLATLGYKPGDDGFIDPKQCLVVGGADLVARMAAADPNNKMRWGQRAGLFDSEDGPGHVMFRGEDGTGNGTLRGRTEDAGEFSSVGELNDAQDLARKRMGVARLEVRVERVELKGNNQGDPWHPAAEGHEVRLTLRFPDGTVKVVYAHNSDITTGLGQAQLPDESILNARDRQTLFQNKTIAGGEDIMTMKDTSQLKDKRILVLGYGPTGGWAAYESAQRGAGQVDWAGTSGEIGGNKSGVAGLRGIDRVQEALDPASKINLTTDRVLAIKPEGKGAIVTYLRGETGEKYTVQYDLVVSAISPDNTGTKATTQSPDGIPNAGTMLEGIDMRPQGVRDDGTTAPVLESSEGGGKDGAVRVIGSSAAEGVNLRSDDDRKELTKRQNSLRSENAADSPDHRVYQFAGSAAEQANKPAPDEEN